MSENDRFGDAGDAEKMLPGRCLSPFTVGPPECLLVQETVGTPDRKGQRRHIIFLHKGLGQVRHAAAFSLCWCGKAARVWGGVCEVRKAHRQGRYRSGSR
jgi:hypothetical protein